MKNPKWKCANDTGTHKVKFGGKFLTQWDGYHLTLEQSTGGTISADKLKGYQEQSANLSYTADTFYHFNGWNSTGANIQNNQVPFTADTTAKANFVYDPIPTSAQSNIKGVTWMNHDLDYDDGGPGIIRVDNPVYYYRYYSAENADPVTLRVDLPGPVYYYNLYAANRIANKISGWHLSTIWDWDQSFGVAGSVHWNYTYLISRQNTRKWFPSGANYTFGSQETDFNGMPYSNYDRENRFIVSAGDYRVTPGGHPTCYDLISNWWIASSDALSGIIYHIEIDEWDIRSIGPTSPSAYYPVRLVKD